MKKKTIHAVCFLRCLCIQQGNCETFFASYVIIIFKILFIVFYLFHLYTKYKVISFVCNIDKVCILCLAGLNLISMVFFLDFNVSCTLSIWLNSEMHIINQAGLPEKSILRLSYGQNQYQC